MKNRFRKPFGRKKKAVRTKRNSIGKVRLTAAFPRDTATSTGCVYPIEKLENAMRSDWFNFLVEYFSIWMGLELKPLEHPGDAPKGLLTYFDGPNIGELAHTAANRTIGMQENNV